MDIRHKKEDIIGFFVVLFSIISWYMLRRLFRLEEIAIIDYIITILAFVVFLGIYNLLCFLATRWRVIILISLFSALSFFLSFHFNWYDFFVALLFFCALVINFGRVKDEKADRISLNVFHSLRHSLFWAILVLIMFTSLTYYFALQEKNEEVHLKLPPIAIKATSNYLVTLLSAQLFPGASFGAKTTVDEVIRDSLKTQLEDPAYNIISEEEKERLIKEQVPAQREALSEEVGFDLLGGERITEVILRASDTKINELLAPYRAYIPLILALSLFMTLIAASPFIKWLSIFLTFILFKILIAIKFVSVEKIQREAEIIKFNNKE